MAKLSLAFYSALVLGGAAAGCTDAVPPPGSTQAAVGIPPETAAQSGALQSSDLDDNPGQVPARDGVVHRPVAVKHVIDPSQGAQVVAPAGVQPATTNPVSSPQTLGTAHRRAR